ncbi:MAG TPA: alpha-2-macroglobulin family protein [Ignavibacteriaceae bacterium]|nr:alpha-2-macroglobulin family protein [Ignavibacteriaceae bacterium]
MKNRYLLLLLIPLAFLLLAFSSLIPGVNMFDSDADNEFTFQFKNDYKAAWQKVDSLEQKGLTRSALEVVEEIYKAAKKDNNQPQFIKSVFYKLKYGNYIEEDSHVKIVNDVKAEIDAAQFPANAILESILANVYWQYYQNNRWRFQQRTETVNFDNEDFQTWDLARLIREVVKYFNASLEQSEKLKKIPLKEFEDILVYGTTEHAYLRPTLYDLLAHQALAFFVNDEASVTQPVYKFELKSEDDFSPADEFVDINYSTKDSLSLKFYAIQLYQKLVAFHLDDKEKDALIDVDLARLNFVRTISVHPTKDSLYISVIIKMEKQFSNVPYSSLISFNKAQYYYNEGMKYSPSVSDDYKWEIKKALEICNSVIEKYPETYGAGECRWLQNTILQKSLSVQTEYGNIPDQPFRALVTYKNVNKIYIRVIPWNESLTNKEKNLNSQQLIQLYSSQKPSYEWSVDLPDDKDYQQHSVEIKMPALSVGQYLVLVGTDSEFSYLKNAVGYSKTWVTNISYIRKSEENNNEHFYVLNRKSGKPISNVKFEFYGQRYEPDDREYKFFLIKSGFTDEQGSIVLNKSTASYNSYKVIFIDKNDRFESQNFYAYSYQQKAEKRTTTFFYLDRAIYRPGQVVYFKGLMIETDGKKDHKIITGRKTTVTFLDANYQKISDATFTTNEYGTFNGQFTIPLGKIGGQYMISNENGSQYFRVEEYKRPKFEVKFDPVKGSYSLNDKVTVDGFAKTYSGANLNDVDVKYRVVRTVYFPYYDFRWRWYYNWFWGRYNEMEITNGMTTTDKEGKFKIEFDLVPDLSMPKETKPVFSYTVYADVIDVTGETHSAQTYVSAGYVALVANINIPEIVKSDSIVRYQVTTTNLNGQFEPAQIAIEVHKLKSPDRNFRKRLWSKPDKFLMAKEEFYKNFTNDIYDEENEYFNWEKERKEFQTSFVTNDSAFISFKNLPEWQPGKYVLILKTKDKNGTPVELTKYFTLFDPESKKTPLNEASWVYLNERSYEPGETAKLFIGSAEKNVKVLYELTYDSKIIKKEWISLDNEQKIIDIPIKEEYRGNLVAHVSFIVNNEPHLITKVISVPWTNKQLKISFETFRNKLLPGSKEEWKLKISGPNGDAVAAELLASMYDASLDVFAANYWGFNIHPYFYSRYNWTADNNFQSISSNFYNEGWNLYYNRPYMYYPYINNFGFYFYGYGYGIRGGRGDEVGFYLDSNAPKSAVDIAANLSGVVTEEKEGLTASKLGKEEDRKKDGDKSQGLVTSTQPEQSFEGVSIRKNLNETAFFYPELRTNEKGEIIISFTVPEALTRWKFMGFALTKDLKSSIVYNETVTQKDLMIMPNPPRFLREGDEIYFTAKVSNLSDTSITGSATLQLFDAFTMNPVDGLFENTDNVKSFSAEKGMSEGLSWRLKVPLGKVDAIVYRVIAKSGEFSDGEENALPILINRMLVTETLPLPVRGNQTKTFLLKKLMENNSSTLQNYNLTLEFTANPAWYAIQALPYMMEYPYECIEQVFNRFYANSIATHIANSSPKIKKVFDTWKEVDKDALLSNLEKNQELKYALLEETPWVLDAQDESERKRRVGLLFDLVKMAGELERAEKKMQEMQYSNGGWPWFPGLPENRFITQYIVVGMGHLERLGIKDIRENATTWEMLRKAVIYTDIRMYEDYEWIKKHGILDKKNIGYTQAQYLYGRSYYLDIPVDDKYKEAFDYWKGQAQKYWLSNNKYMQGMIALALYRMYDAKTAKDIIKSIIENAVFNDEMGMYFKEEWGWYWYQAPIETQALLIEAVDEIVKDQKSVDEMKIWLLKQKQVQDWKTTKATAEACYALLLRGSDWLADTKMPDIKIGGQMLDLLNNPEIHIEAGTGYFKTSWKGEEITPSMGEVTVTNNNNVVAWGSLYWQYYEQLDKITPAETPLKIKKQLFLELDSPTGKKITPVDENTKLKPGDLIKVRIEIRVDRDMEFVHMKDMRAAGFEPINVLSTHKYQDGLWYYENTRDAATNFFMDYLRKGTYVFEYPLRVTHKGDFSNGITTIQCMYAPEFASHSEGVRVKVQ